jgi:hypothetical protein
MWNCERNVGEYNILDLVKDNTKKQSTVKNKNCTVIFEMQAKGHN